MIDSSLTDVEIRPLLKDRLLSSHAPDTIILDELGVCRGQVRIDLALVNGIIHGYEIKSERDSLRRLSGQIEFYGKVLDRATLVVARRHLSVALTVLPSWWGVLCVDKVKQGHLLKNVRKGKLNPRRDARALVELLWLDDALELLRQHQLDRGMKGKPRRLVWDRVCENFDIEEIASAVRQNLKARAETQVARRQLQDGE